MLVSTSAATAVEILAPPSALARGSTSTLGPLAPPLALLGAVEESKALLDARPERAAARGDHANRIPSGLPVDLVAGLDPVAVCQRPGDRHLELAGDLRHGPYPSKDGFLAPRSG